MSLFDDVQRTDSSPSRASEGSFEFLNRVNTPFWSEVRRVLDLWFLRYPRKHQQILRKQFRSKHRGQHYAGFWELYLHEFFLRLGYEVTVHPELTDSPHRPDFGLAKGRRHLLVEACVVSSEIVPEEDEVQPPPWLLDAVEHISNRDFALGLLEVVTAGPDQPKVKAITNAIDHWLAGLKMDDASSGGFWEGSVSFRGWTVRLMAWPRDAAERETRQRRVLQMGSVAVGDIFDIDQLRDTLKKKAGRYGRPTVPLVTAVLADATFMSRNDTHQALYGRRAMQYHQRHAGVRGPLPPPKWIRQNDGFWIRGDGPQNQRVSAVLLVKQLHPASVGEVAPELWLNPWADNVLDEQWPFTTITSDDSRELNATERRPDMPAFFGLDPGWPGPTAFPDDR